MRKIPRIQEVVMRWRFGDYNREVLRREPNPPIVAGLESPELQTTLTSAVATLGGKAGEIEFIFFTPKEEHGFFVRNELSDLMHRMVEGWAMSDVRLGIVVESKHGYFSFSLKFPSKPGEAFTATANRFFVETLRRYLRPESLINLPIPQVVSRTVWRIGEEKVPFGAALALDAHMDGAFRRIRRVYRERGEVAAGELCRRLLIALRSKECSSLVFSETEGAEVLIGGSMLRWISLSLLVDGYSRHSVKFGSASCLSEQAKQVARILKAFRLKECVIFSGQCLDFAEGKRTACEELEQGPFELFVEALKMEGIEVIE